MDVNHLKIYCLMICFIRLGHLKTMQRVVENLDSNKIFVLGAITTNTEIDQKYKWLSEHYPNIKKENVFFYMFYIIKTRSYN